MSIIHFSLIFLICSLLGFGLARLLPTTEGEATNSSLPKRSQGSARKAVAIAPSGGFRFVELLQGESEEFRRLVANDPNAALAEVLKRRLTPESRSLIAGLLSEIGRRNPLLVDELLAAVKSPRERKMILEELIGIWAESDPDAAKGFLLVQTKGVGRSKMIQTLVDKLLETEPQETMSWIESDLAGHERKLASRNAFKRMADLDPEVATKLLEDLRPGLLKNQNMDAIARRLAAKDISEAFDWLKEQAEGPQKDRTYRTLMEKFAAQNPAAASEAIATLDDIKLKERLLNTVVQKMAIKDPLSAYRFSEKLPAGDARLELRGEIVARLAEENWKEAFDFAARSQDAAEYEFLTAQAIFVGAKGDPLAAASLVSGLPEGRNLAALTESIAWAYAEKDFEGALDWARGIQNEASRDSAIISLVEVSSDSDARRAFQLANDITNNQARADYLEATVINLLNVDEEAGFEALSHPSITPEMASRIEAARQE